MTSLVFHYVQITTPLGTLEANEVVEGGKIDALWVSGSIPDAVGVSGTHCAGGCLLLSWIFPIERKQLFVFATDWG